MTFAMTSSFPTDMEERFASFRNQNSDLLEGISTDELADSGNEVEIVRELKTSFSEHQCNLCCEGSFLVNKILQFGGVITDLKKHGCTLCCKAFRTESELSRHMDFHKIGMLNSDAESEPNRLSIPREAEKATFNCHICFSKCKSPLGLQRHMTNKHKNENSFTHKCEVCMAAFHDFEDFTRHCSSHKLKQKFLVCLTCKKKFLWKNNLSKHICTVE